MTLGHDDRLRKHAVLAAAVTCATVLFGLAFAPAMSFGVLPLFLVPVMISADVGRTRAGLPPAPYLHAATGRDERHSDVQDVIDD